MLDQFSLQGALPRNIVCQATDFPARIERDMDLLLSLLGQSSVPPSIFFTQNTQLTLNHRVILCSPPSRNVPIHDQIRSQIIAARQ